MCDGELFGTVLLINDKEAIDREQDRLNRGYPPSEHGIPKPTFLNLTDASMKMVRHDVFWCGCVGWLGFTGTSELTGLK